MAQKMKKALVGAAGLLALQNGLSGLTPALAADFSADVSDPAPGFSDTAADARAATTVTIDGAAIEKTEETAYDTIANVSGQFTYDQTILSPSDQVFSLFGTAATAACAAPSFTFETMSGDDAAEYYINVGGRLEKAMKLSLDDLKGQGITDTLKCSCAMSPSIVNAEVTGVALSSILQMADLERDVAFQVGSQITFEGYADDYDVAVSAVEFSLDVLRNARSHRRTLGLLVFHLRCRHARPLPPGRALPHGRRQSIAAGFQHCLYGRGKVKKPS